MKLRLFLSTCALALVAAQTIAPLPARAQGGEAAAAGTDAKSPGPWLKATVERARKLAERKPKTAGAEEEAWRKEVKDAINDVVDWGELTQRSLGKTWDARTPAERDEFSKLLRGIVEASYEQRLRMVGQGDAKERSKVDITWGEEKVTGDTAIANAKVKSGKDQAGLQFALKRAGDKWRVYDVTIDDVSTLRTYRSQFNKIITEKGFPELIARMKKKIDEIKSGKGEIKSSDLKP